jgi:hypothetical protein
MVFSFCQQIIQIFIKNQSVKSVDNNNYNGTSLLIKCPYQFFIILLTGDFVKIRV